MGISLACAFLIVKGKTSFRVTADKATACVRAKPAACLGRRLKRRPAGRRFLCAAGGAQAGLRPCRQFWLYQAKKSLLSLVYLIKHLAATNRRQMRHRVAFKLAFAHAAHSLAGFINKAVFRFFVNEMLRHASALVV